MRVVLDANIFVSALIAQNGNPAKVLNLWQEGKFELVISLSILEEIYKVTHYSRIQKKYKLSEEQIVKFLKLLSDTAIIVEPKDEVSVVEKDPTDDRYIECALEGNASFIVTGDTHLLDLGKYRDIFILTPAGFLALIRLEEDNASKD